MYKLYDFLPSGNCYKVRLLLNQLGIEYTRVNGDADAMINAPEKHLIRCFWKMA